MPDSKRTSILCFRRSVFLLAGCLLLHRHPHARGALRSIRGQHRMLRSAARTSSPGGHLRLRPRPRQQAWSAGARALSEHADLAAIAPRVSSSRERRLYSFATARLSMPSGLLSSRERFRPAQPREQCTPTRVGSVCRRLAAQPGALFTDSDYRPL
jgi:hypothetical protein